MLQRITPITSKILLSTILVSQLFGCGIDGNNTDNGSLQVSPEAVISGSVGDGPIVGATLNIYDKDGNLIQTEMSDNSASYSARIKAAGNAYPLTIEVTDGTDLVTGLAPDFKLVSIVAHPSIKRVNINPFTTLIVESARSMNGGLGDENIAVAKATIIDKLNFGLDPALVADPIGTDINDGNIANVVKSSEALGEMIRRSRDNLISTGTVSHADDVVHAIADDLADGIMDGLGGNRANARIAAVATLTSAQVLIESLSNNLKVDGLIATDALDNSILTVRPTVAGGALTGDVRINQEMLDQTRRTVAAASALTPAMELNTISGILDLIQTGSLPSEIEPVLPGDSSQDLDQFIALAVSATDEELAAVNDSIRLDQEPGTGGGGSTNNTTNSAPLISGNATFSVDAGTLYSFQPSSSDVDGDTLSFSIVNRPSWATFNRTSGALSGTPGELDAGVYTDISISVSDGNASSSLPAFSISVNAAQATNNTAPVISGAPAGNVSEDSSYVFQPTTSDPDGDNLTFAINNRPSWATFQSSTGRLSGTPRNADVGTYNNISITVSDGSASASIGPFSITVSNTNDAPFISGSPVASVDEGDLYVFQPSASDQDGDSLTYSIQNRPGWASFNSGNGRLAGTPGTADAGTYDKIVISVSDGNSSVSLPAFSISVNSTAPSLGAASLNWGVPVARADGTALAMGEISGYTLYYGTTTGNYPNSVDIDDAYTTSATVSGLTAGTYYFVVTTRDITGLESGYSSVATRQIQ